MDRQTHTHTQTDMATTVTFAVHVRRGLKNKAVNVWPYTRGVRLHPTGSICLKKGSKMQQDKKDACAQLIQLQSFQKKGHMAKLVPPKMPAIWEEAKQEPSRQKTQVCSEHHP